MGLSSPSGSPSPSYKFQNIDEDTAGSSAQQFASGTHDFSVTVYLCEK